MRDSVKISIGCNVKDLNFQNLVMLGNFWNGLMLFLLIISRVSKICLATLKKIHEKLWSLGAGGHLPRPTF